VADTSKEELSEMMVGRKVVLSLEKQEAKVGDLILDVKNLTMKGDSSHKNKLTNVSLTVNSGEIVCVAGIDGNGQTDLVYALTGLAPIDGGSVTMLGTDITKYKVRQRGKAGMAHIPEDRHKHGLILDYTLAYNAVLQKYFAPRFQKGGFLKKGVIREYADYLIKRFDIRSGRGADTIARSMSGGNQQKVIIAREIDREHRLLIAVQPTRGLDVGAIEYIHNQLLKQRDDGEAILLISLEMEEVMNISDRILVMYEGEIVANVDPKKVTYQELGLYMSGAKREVGV
jgi:simple sugar transport system ATP-binding protein